MTEYPSRLEALVTQVLEGEEGKFEDAVIELQLICEHQGYRNSLTPRGLRDLIGLASTYRATHGYKALAAFAYLAFGTPEIEILLNKKRSLLEVGNENYGTHQNLISITLAVAESAQILLTIAEDSNTGKRTRGAAIYVLTWIFIEPAEALQKIDLMHARDELARLHIFLWTYAATQVAATEELPGTILGDILKTVFNRPAVPEMIIYAIAKRSARSKLMWFGGNLLALATLVLSKDRTAGVLATFVRELGVAINSCQISDRAEILKILLYSVNQAKQSDASFDSEGREVLRAIAGVDGFWEMPGGYINLDTIYLLDAYGIPSDRASLSLI